MSHLCFMCFASLCLRRGHLGGRRQGEELPLREGLGRLQRRARRRLRRPPRQGDLGQDELRGAQDLMR